MNNHQTPICWCRCIKLVKVAALDLGANVEAKEANKGASCQAKSVKSWVVLVSLVLVVKWTRKKMIKTSFWNSDEQVLWVRQVMLKKDKESIGTVSVTVCFRAVSFFYLERDPGTPRFTVAMGMFPSRTYICRCFFCAFLVGWLYMFQTWYARTCSCGNKQHVGPMLVDVWLNNCI